jgi:P-type conjugative transfer protein TrbJ
MKIALTLASAFFMFLIMAAPSQALTVACVNCSDNWTQQMDRITNLEQLQNALKSYQEAIQQTQQQIQLVQNNIKQYENMVQNTLNLPQNLLNQVKGQFSELAKLTSQLKFQKGDYLAMSQVFDETYPELDLLKTIVDGTGSKTVAEVWEKWSKETDRAAQATFQVTGSQLKDLAEDSEALDRHISDLLSTPEGQMQAIQSGNSLAAIQVSELRQLRALMAASIQSTTQAMMKNEKREQLSVEQRDYLLDDSGLASQYQGYK